jgi:transposase
MCSRVAQITAVTMVAETGSLKRFQNPRQLMSYSSLVSSEHSHSNRIQRGGITKTGHAASAQSAGGSGLVLSTQRLSKRLSVET